MSAIQPVATYSLRIPPGDVLVPATPGFVQMFRLTMAAIDPSEEPELEEAGSQTKPRATLKVVRMEDEDLLDDSDYDDDDDDEDDDDDDEDDEELNGGPSVKKSKKDLSEEDDEDMDEDDEDDSEEDEEDTAAAIAALKKAMKKGKNKAVDGEEEDSEDEDDEAIELDQTVLCTLDADSHYQQPLDFVVAEGEKIFFKVSGAYTVHLTGNYVMPLDDDMEDDEDEEDYDDVEDEELDGLDALLDGGDESDELDDIDDPRVMEVDSEEEKPAQKKDSKKGKNKRPADSDEEEDAALDDLMAKSLAAAEEKPKKLSKAEKRAAKKQKDNEGNAVESATPTTNGTSDSDKKKVQFAKNLEQGPTPSKADAKKDDKPAVNGAAAALGKRTVQGIEIDDRKIGTGPAAKKGSRLEMRYIGKLKSNNKLFDSNKSGKPFSVKVGVGEVIKGWDIGLQGISAGGERRLIIPAKMAYGSKELPGIPKNSDLVFDVKCLSVK